MTDPNKPIRLLPSPSPSPNGVHDAGAQEIPIAAEQVQEQVQPEKEPRKTHAATLLELAADCILSHDEEGRCFIEFEVKDHREVWPIFSTGTRRYLAGKYFDRTGGAAGSQALQDALNVLAAKAQFEGNQEAVFVRLGQDSKTGSVYVFLADDKWQVVRVTPFGWQVIPAADAPVKFRRPKGMLPLPMPERGGSISELRPFTNCDESSWILFVALLFGCFNPRGPYPIGITYGEQGTAKTTLARIHGSLVDPNVAQVRSGPRSPHDLMIAASNSRLLSFDNLSAIADWFSDALCRISTGGATTVRELYSDTEQTILNVMLPVWITSITDVASRQDLLDRAVLLSLQPIPDDKRRPESELWAAFEEVRPRILGALLDAVVTAMLHLPSTKLDSLPRMADFALWVAAGAPSLGFSAQDFMDAYQANRATASTQALEAEPLAERFILHANALSEDWQGTASELLKELEKTLETRPSGDKAKPDWWPKSARVLSDSLKRMAPTLRRSEGIDLQWSPGRRNGKVARLITIRKGIPNSVNSVNSVNITPETHNNVDADLENVDAGKMSTSTPASTFSPQATHENGLVDAVDAVDAEIHSLSYGADDWALDADEEPDYDELQF